MNNEVQVFRDDENLKRLNSSADRLLMPHVSEKVWQEVLDSAIRENQEYIPPYKSRGSMYIRPLLFGSGPILGVAPSNEYTFACMVSPIGNYYKSASNGIKAYVQTDFDRVAPKGTGRAKAAANYVADLLPTKNAKEKGCSASLYLDPKENKYIEEFGTSNFATITKGQ